MARLIAFPKKKLHAISAHPSRPYRIAIEVLDTVRPRRTRWRVQFEVQEAAGFLALRGFKDVAVRAGYRHRFSINRTAALRRFVSELADLVRDGKVALWVDGVMIRPIIVEAA